MSLHGAKGLSFGVVFVPGLEEGLLPSERAAPIPSQVQEAARLLYVAITRARSACLLSYSGTRVVRGEFGGRVPSRLVQYLGAFDRATDEGLDEDDVGRVTHAYNEMA